VRRGSLRNRMTLSSQAHADSTDVTFSSAGSAKGAIVTAWRMYWRDLVVFLCLLGLGAASLPTPFGGDQGLNILIGQVIADGGAPYRDVWDLKHPGIFLFFAAGGSLFGFDEFGLHVFELIWMLALALVARVVAARWLEDRTSVSLAPLLTVGLYYAIARDLHLTQAESLVGLPLLVSLWCALEAVRAGRRPKVWFFASGVAGGIAMVFKFPYVAIPIAFWLLAIRELRFQRQYTLWRAVAVVVPWAITGALVPLLATVAYLTQKRLWPEAYWSFVTHPADAAAETPIVDLQRLYYAARFWIVSWSPALALAAIGMAEALRRRVDLIDAALCAWLFAGLTLVMGQVISWWEYHFLLLFVPAGLLATRGVQAILQALRLPLEPGAFRLRYLMAAAALLLMFAPQLIPAGQSMTAFWSSRPLPLSRERMAVYHARRYPAYASIRSRTAFLRAPGSHPGPIYVFDLPVYYLYAGRRPAIPWVAPWFHPTDRPWKRLLADLNGARPPYVRVAAAGLQGIVDHRPSLRDDVAGIVPFIERRYRVLSRDDDGTWYIRRDLPDEP
jgi:hypothetical protein